MLAHGGEEALGPQVAGAVGGVALDEADAAMAQPQQVAGHLGGGRRVVGLDRGAERPGQVGRDAHAGQAPLVQRAQNLDIVRQRRRQDEPVRQRPLQQPRHLLVEIAGGGVHLLYDQVVAGRAALAQRAELQLQHVARARVVEQQRQQIRARARQAAREDVRPVVQLGQNRLDPLAGFARHVLFAVHHPRYSLDRHARTGGHIAQGDGAFRLQLRFPIVFCWLT